MSDTRFTIIGIALIFAGFIVLGIFGGDFRTASIESNEFGTCYEYSDSAPPIEINCSYKLLDQTVFFGLVIGLIITGIISLFKGIKGNWDQKVKPEDMVGPSKNDNKDEKD